MIPRTFLSTYAVNGQQQMVVAFLDNITGLTRWVDYIPVKLAQGGRENSYDNNGFIDVAVVAKSLTSVPFKDYVPVYADTAATDAWQVNFTGYIPYGYAGSGDASLMLDFTSNFQAFDSRITFTRTSNATYFNSAGLLTNTSFNTLTYSNNLENAAWVKTNATVTANVTTGPFGVVDAERLTEDTATSDHKIAQATASSVATKQVFSIYAKADTRSVLSLTMSNTGGNAQFNNFDLTAGTATGSPTTSLGWTGATASIVSVGNGWYRCILTANSAGTTGITATASIVVGGSTNYTGNGTSGLFLYGAQLQTGVVSAYIPTTTVANSLPRLDYNPVTLAAQGLLIEEQRVNLLTYSSEFDNAGWIKFGTTTVAANSTTSITGNVDADGVTLSASSGIYQAVATAATTTYTLSIWIKADSAQSVNFIANTNLSEVTTLPVSVTTSWQRVTLQKTTTTGTSVTIQVSTGVTGATVYLYGAQLEAGAFATSYIPSVNTFTSRSTTGSYFDSAGVLQSAAINVARNTYNPANLAAQPFLLLEEARTNSIRNNTMVGAVAGTPGTPPTNWSVFTALTGLTREIVGTGTESGITYIDIRVSGTPSGSGTLSIIFEANNQIAASTGQTWAQSAYLKLQTGSLTGITSTVFQIEECTAVAFVRTNISSALTITGAALATQRSLFAATLSGGATVAFVVSYATLNLSGVAIDITLRIGLPQLEQGAYATSVIPTTIAAVTRAADISSSAQATRAADIASVNTLSPWYNASEGTLYAEVTVPQIGRSARIVALDAGSTTDMIDTTLSVANTFGIEAVAGGVYGGSTLVANTVTANAIQKTAATYSTSANETTCLNGGTVASSNVTLPSTSLTTMRLGYQSNFAATLNGYLRRITYYPRRLSDAELISLTT